MQFQITGGAVAVKSDLLGLGLSRRESLGVEEKSLPVLALPVELVPLLHLP